MEKIQIIIDKKEPYTGNADRHPEGDFFENGVKYTCWDKTIFDKYQVGDVIKFSYTSKENTYEGKTYVNKNISKIIAEEQTNPTTTEEVITKTFQPGTDSPSSVSHLYKIGNLEYEVTIRLLP